MYYACAGDTDGLFEALESAYQRRYLHLLSVRRVVFFVPYHGDPRFQSLLRRMNLA